jgi:HD-GYP domain-containing protein (c-di-GMP phosphodiesterase class II)
MLLGPRESGALFAEQDIVVLETAAVQSAASLRSALLFDDKSRRVAELESIERLSGSIGPGMRLPAVLEAALERVSAAVAATSASVMRLDTTDRTLSVAASTGASATSESWQTLRLGEGVSGWVAASRKALVILDDDDGTGRHGLVESARPMLSAPILLDDDVVGVITLNRDAGAAPFSQENLHAVTSFANQLAVAIENARRYGALEGAFLGTISALAAAIDAKDPYRAGHSEDVTRHAIATAGRLGMNAAEVDSVRLATVLRDMGKIGIDGSILQKPGPLTEEERALVNRHPTIGADILGPLEFLAPVIPLILFHHERPDGTGYPSGISGSAIPLGARIIAVADSYHAMISDRPYREGLSPHTARQELLAGAGGQFDAEVIDAFLEVISEEP